MVNNVISISGYSNLLLQLPNSAITNVRAVHIRGRSLKTNQYAHFDINRVVRTRSNCMQNRMSDINCQLIGRPHAPIAATDWYRHEFDNDWMGQPTIQLANQFSNLLAKINGKLFRSRIKWRLINSNNWPAGLFQWKKKSTWTIAIKTKAVN